MAVRPVFTPGFKGPSLVIKIEVDFKWFAGMAVSQKQKSIRSLHESASDRNIKSVLEISSKSEAALGVSLSAFNLKLQTEAGYKSAVENFYQSSKVFTDGGPYLDILDKKPWEAKKDPRLASSGGFVGFEYGGHRWPTKPINAFYDWLYLNALCQNPALSAQLEQYDGFTDIEFNPEKSLNCQASAAALFVALSKRGELNAALANRDSFFERLSLNISKPQTDLF
jgi:hypothetical protein